MSKGNIHIGTSGWSYEHWKGPFYPEDIANEKMLEHYQLHFQTVEINNSFYHLPKRQTLAHWAETVPHNFIFSAKASRYITHMKKLNEPEKSTQKFFDVITALEERLGPILFQLPPHWKFNRERFEIFLNTLSKDFRYTFEFRDPSWINDETLELLEKHNIAFCIYNFSGYLSPKEVTTNFVYIRLHGPKGPYEGLYSKTAMQHWADDITNWRKKGLSVFCYFDNDQYGYAAKNALQLQEMLAG